MQQASAGREKWWELHDEICRVLAALLDLPAVALPDETAAFNTFAAFVAGFVSTCDWIGSDERYFEYEERNIEVGDYYARSLERARDALSE